MASAKTCVSPGVYSVKRTRTDASQNANREYSYQIHIGHTRNNQCLPTGGAKETRGIGGIGHSCTQLQLRGVLGTMPPGDTLTQGERQLQKPWFIGTQLIQHAPSKVQLVRAQKLAGRYKLSVLPYLCTALISL